MTQVRFYDQVDGPKLRFAVIVTKTNFKQLFFGVCPIRKTHCVIQKM